MNTNLDFLSDDYMPLDEAADLLAQGFILEDTSLAAEFSTYFTD